LSFSYKIDNNVFYLIHYTEFATSGLNSNYSNFKGINYLSRKNQYEAENAKFDNLVNNFKGNSIDFFGGEMRFYKLGLNKDKAIDSNVFFTDIDDIFKARGESYNTESTNQFVLMSLQRGNNEFYLRDAVGLTSGERTSNADLSFSNLANKVISDIPDTESKINGVEVTVDQNRKSKLNVTSFKFPFCIFSEVDFLKGVDFFNDVAEFTTVSKNVGQDIAEAEIKY